MLRRSENPFLRPIVHLVNEVIPVSQKVERYERRRPHCSPSSNRRWDFLPRFGRSGRAVSCWQLRGRRPCFPHSKQRLVFRYSSFSLSVDAFRIVALVSIASSFRGGRWGLAGLGLELERPWLLVVTGACPNELPSALTLILSPSICLYCSVVRFQCLFL